MGNAMFCGVGCALATPFRGGDVDFEAFEHLVDRQLAAGTDALIVCGTTGEPSTLTEGEMCDLVAVCASRACGRAPVIAGAGANATRTAARRAKLLTRAGADAVLCVTPYYNRANPQGLIEHFTKVADAADAPVILYNVPARTGVNLLPETVAQLLKHPMIQGVKEACADISQAADLLRAAGDGCYVYCGNDDMILPMLAMGARGAISVCANVAPALTRSAARAALRGDLDDARDAYFKLLPLIRALFSDVSPIPLKAALSMMGLVRDELRLPLTPLGGEKRAALAEALAALDAGA